MRTLRLHLLAALTLCLAAASLAGCHRPGPPSPDYQKASALWLDLLREKKLSEACTDPAADTALALVARVDPGSIDARPAADLKAEIEKCRAAARADEEALRKQLEEAQAAVQDPVFAGGGETSPFAVSPSSSDGGAAGGGRDGGSDEIQPGMSAADFQSRHGRCFEDTWEATVEGRAGGRVWLLKDLMVCREKYPKLVESGVVLFEGKVVNVQPASALAPQTFRLENGKLVPDDGKKPGPAPAPAPAPESPPPPAPGNQPRRFDVPQPVAPTADPKANPQTTLPITGQP